MLSAIGLFAMMIAAETMQPHAGTVTAAQNERTAAQNGRGLTDMYTDGDAHIQFRGPPKILADLYTQPAGADASADASGGQEGTFEERLRATNRTCMMEATIFLWVSCLVVALATTAAVIGHAFFPHRVSKLIPCAAKSRLVGASVDVKEVPAGTVCAVCLECSGMDSELQETWCQTPCEHLFHKECLDRWLTSARPGYQRCPLCNYS